MKQKIIFLMALTLILTSCIAPCEPKICFETKCYEVEIPRTQEEFQTGLMHRENLLEHKGMLFIFQEEKKHTFWMKNTLIPLDMIWLNEDLEVVHIEQATPCKQEPCKIYAPNKEALYVLEINAGQTEKQNMTTKSQAELNLCK